jgi:hypothetical protein
MAAVYDAIGKARIHFFPAEMEVWFAGVANRPFADALIQIEQAGFTRDLWAWLGRNKPTWRRWRGGRSLITRPLAQETAGAY